MRERGTLCLADRRGYIRKLPYISTGSNQNDHGYRSGALGGAAYKCGARNIEVAKRELPNYDTLIFGFGLVTKKKRYH